MQAAKITGKPVKWVNTRQESFVSDHGGRDNQKTLTIGVDASFRFTALKIVNEVDIGAYVTGGNSVGPLRSSNLVSQGVYAIDKACSLGYAYFSNKTPIGAYRGAWRPESIHALERMVDYVAYQLKIAPDKLRMLNAIDKKAMPYMPFTGILYDSGDFKAAIEKAKKRSKWESFAKRKALSLKRGMLRGIGMAAYTEIVPMNSIGAREGRLELAYDGKLRVYLGSNSSGTHISSTIAAYLAKELGVDVARIEVDTTDSEKISQGAMSGGSTTTANSYQVVQLALDALIQKCKGQLQKEANAHAITYKQGMFFWGKKKVGLLDLPKYYPHFAEIVASEVSVAKSNTYSSGCYVFEVEINPQTGWITIVDGTCVNDIGRVMNPLHVEGQIQGGVAQGLGQTLMEYAKYDDQGHLVADSFWNYAIPKAEDFCNISQSYSTHLTESNHFGIKGCGEVGTVATPPALANAVLNALGDYEIAHLDMPYTPEKIWRLINGFKTCNN